MRFTVLKAVLLKICLLGYDCHEKIGLSGINKLYLML